MTSKTKGEKYVIQMTHCWSTFFFTNGDLHVAALLWKNEIKAHGNVMVTGGKTFHDNLNNSPSRIRQHCKCRTFSRSSKRMPFSLIILWLLITSSRCIHLLSIGHKLKIKLMMMYYILYALRRDSIQACTANDQADFRSLKSTTCRLLLCYLYIVHSPNLT